MPVRAKDNMNHISKYRTVASHSVTAHQSADRRSTAPRSAVLTPRELRRIVAEMLG